MTDKEIDAIEARAVPLDGAPKEDLMALVDEVRRLKKAIRKHSAYRSMTYPNIGKVVIPEWARMVLDD